MRVEPLTLCTTRFEPQKKLGSTHGCRTAKSWGKRGINSTTIRKFDRVKEMLERELAYDKKGKQMGAKRATQWRNEVVEAKNNI